MEAVSKKVKKSNNVEQKFKLIDGIFSPSEAADVLDSILDVKINHHKLKRLSITEGNAKDLCVYDNDRINELIDAKLDAKLFFNDARLNHKKLIIKSTVTIKIED